MESYDILIVGAGPAGSTAALYAQRAGFKTCLIDKCTFPRDKICGDAIPSGAKSILYDLNLYQKVMQLPLTETDHYLLKGPSNHSFKLQRGSSIEDTLDKTKKTSGMGLLIKRVDFDNFLFTEAKKVSDKTYSGYKVKQLVWDNDQVVGVIAQGDDQTIELRARIIIGADGFNSIVAQQSGLYQHHPKHSSVAIRRYYQGVKCDTKSMLIHFANEIPLGYFWIFPLANDITNVGLGLRHDIMKKKQLHIKNIFDELITGPTYNTVFSQAQALEPHRGWNLPMASMRRRSVANGVILLGDASGLIDPFSGHGISNAMLSAKIEIQSLCKNKLEQQPVQTTLKYCESQIWTTMKKDFLLSSLLQKLGNYPAVVDFIFKKISMNPKIVEAIQNLKSGKSSVKKTLLKVSFWLKLVFAKS